jgi:molecular chaperone GrpE
MAEDILNNDNNSGELADQAEAQNNQQTSESEAPSETAVLKTRIDELQKQAETLKDQFLRKAAEFENYKRRVEADFASLIKNANESLITSLLPILNDFLRSLKAGAETKDYESFYKGVEMMYSKFSKILEAQGLAPFDSLGKPFDVEYHDALLQMPKEGVPPHTVIEEVERGYKLNDRVLRHAKVIVSAAPSPAPEQPSNPEEVKA